MPDTNPMQTELPDPESTDTTEPALLRISEKTDPSPSYARSGASIPSAEARAATPPSSRAMERPGTIEHLAARRPAPELDPDTPEMKQRLADLRKEITRLLTGLRWEGISVEETAESLIPHLNVGSIQQWKPVLLPFLHEIDRAGNLIPVWLYIIEKGDPQYLPPQANPAETQEGRARRFAILMLGYYKSVVTVQEKAIGFAKRQSAQQNKTKTVDLSPILGKLVLDPNTSMYASQALIQHGTTVAMQTLISALKEAEGWAKVDIVEGCLELNQEDFYGILIANALERVTGLESYVAVPLYRKVPLEKYLRGEEKISPRQLQQAALIVNHVLQDSINPPVGEGKPLPVVFQRDLPTVAQALFEGARSNPMWQNTIAVHRLGILLGRYWGATSKGELRDPAVIEPVYQCLPMMPEVERWMAGPGRDSLLAVLQADSDEETISPAVRVLGELREPRAISPLLRHLEEIQSVTEHAQALTLGVMCDTLGQLGDRRAVPVLLQFVQRVVDIERRRSTPKRADNLPSGDQEIPGSILYAAVVRACGQLGDRSALNDILSAGDDFDPYVRVQALEALKRLDPRGEDPGSRRAVRAALNDPRENNIRVACQLTQQYRDVEAAPVLQQLIDTRPALSGLAYETLRHLS
jgi:hypothetical protein